MLDFLLKGLNHIYFCTSIMSLKYKPSFPKDEVNQVKTPEHKQNMCSPTGALWMRIRWPALLKGT